MESLKRFLFPDFGLGVLVRLPVSAMASDGQLVSGHVTEGDVNENEFAAKALESAALELAKS